MSESFNYLPRTATGNGVINGTKGKAGAAPLWASGSTPRFDRVEFVILGESLHIHPSCHAPPVCTIALHLCIRYE